MGRVIESLGSRKGQLIEINQDGDLTRIKYIVPTRNISFLLIAPTALKDFSMQYNVFLNRGFNVKSDGAANGMPGRDTRTRIGISANNEADCITPDSRLGRLFVCQL